MERNRASALVLLLLSLLQTGSVCLEGCAKQHERLTCLNDYDSIITCEWNRTSDSVGSACQISAARVNVTTARYSGSCLLEPAHASAPALHRCSLDFNRPGHVSFQTNHVVSISLNCSQVQMFYKPACHIKLNPPAKPRVNSTTISWPPDVHMSQRITQCLFHLQWKPEEQTWTTSQEEEMQCQCKEGYKEVLDSDLLVQGVKYQTRIRVKTGENDYESVWSDWSPTASWVSRVGRPGQTPPGMASSLLGIAVTGVTVLALVVALVLLKTDRTIWVYIVKKIRGPLLPDPGKSFLQDVTFQNWLTPHFTQEALLSFPNPVDIVSVEGTGHLEPAGASRQEAPLPEKTGGVHESTSSSFCNPSYSHLCLPPPISTSFTAGNLEPCAADTPYGPVGSEGQEERAERNGAKEESEILQMFFEASNNCEPLPVISDYERVEVEGAKLSSLDSGLGFGDEAGRGTNRIRDISDKQRGAREEEPELQKVICGSEGIRQAIDSPELPSIDSGMGSGGEEQLSQDEKPEVDHKLGESTRFLFPLKDPQGSPLSRAPPPLSFSESSSGPTPLPLPSHVLMSLASTSRSVEPSGDGYMPVYQEQNI